MLLEENELMGEQIAFGILLECNGEVAKLVTEKF
jgi:hypothetical protein